MTSTLSCRAANQNHGIEPWPSNTCGKCGAYRIDHQLGNEATHDCLGWARGENCALEDWSGACYICRIRLVCKELWRVLRDTGIMWINIGDSYSNDSKWGGSTGGKHVTGLHGNTGIGRSRKGTGLPAGNLMGIPERTALALQSDGWVYRCNVPWLKASAMPESTQSRPCKALEWVLMFTKRGGGYHFDMEAVKKKAVRPGDVQTFGKRSQVAGDYEPGDPMYRGGHEQAGRTVRTGESGRSFRNADLWFESVDSPHGLCGVGDELVGLDVTTRGYDGTHFAVMPEALVRPLLLASTSAKGACGKCGAPWRRVTERVGGPPTTGRRKLMEGRDNPNFKDANIYGGALSSVYAEHGYAKIDTIGWQPTCTCHGRFEKRRVEVLRRVIDAATGKNQTRLDEGTYYCRNKSTLASFSAAEAHEEEIEKTIQVYIPAIPLEEHPVVPCVVCWPVRSPGHRGWPSPSSRKGSPWTSSRSRSPTRGWRGSRCAGTSPSWTGRASS